jgi:hypothetical protein
MLLRTRFDAMHFLFHNAVSYCVTIIVIELHKSEAWERICECDACDTSHKQSPTTERALELCARGWNGKHLLEQEIKTGQAVSDRFFQMTSSVIEPETGETTMCASER